VNEREATAFLEAHQPMPLDSQLTEALATSFDLAVRALAGSTDPRAPSLILNSFGDGDGFGTYQLVDDVLRSLPRDRVIEALRESLRSPHTSVRSWSMDMALDYVDDSLVAPALELLTSGSVDERIPAASFLALFDAHDPATIERLEHAAGRDSDEHVRQFLGDWLETHAH
jgi:hypothetical protein